MQMDREGLTEMSRMQTILHPSPSGAVLCGERAALGCFSENALVVTTFICQIIASLRVEWM